MFSTIVDVHCILYKMGPMRIIIYLLNEWILEYHLLFQFDHCIVDVLEHYELVYSFHQSYQGDL